MKRTKSEVHPRITAPQLQDICYNWYLGKWSVFIFYIYWLCSLLLDLGRFFNFLISYTVGRTPWMGDRHVARPLAAHRDNTNTE
jgi:hypothetical protein